ncbi:hypothetical protein GCM10027048_23850 [Hymenobacter coalescens]
MPEYAQFVPECNVDTALALALLSFRYEFVSHRQGISQVARVLQEQAAAPHDRRRVVGLVDADKKFAQSLYLRQFTELVFGGPTHIHQVLRHPQRPYQHLIVLNPACDAWLYHTAGAAGIHLPDLGLPAALPDFIRFCKQEDVEETPPMQRLLRAIRQARPAPYRELAAFVADVMDLGAPQQVG